MQGCVIQIENVTYTDGVFKDASGATITPYNTFSITMPTLEENKAYDATGVAVWFDKWEIAPRTTDDFVEAGTVIAVAKPVISPAGGTFAEAQTVTITAEEGCTIYYTIDGTDPTDASTQYTTPFTVSSDCTVKAIAYDDADNPSAVTSAVFTFITSEAITNIADLCAAAPTEGNVDVLVQFNNWIVTGVKGGQVYFTDGPNGIVLYQSGHGFVVGDKVSGSAVVSLTLFNECAEILGLSSTTEGITVESGATPSTIALNALSSTSQNKQGCLLHLNEVTYDATNGVFVDGDDNTIAPMKNKFVNIESNLMDGKTYNVTGVAIWYITNGEGAWNVAPRTADEVELVTDKQTPESAWSVEEEVVDINETPTAVFTTNSDGVVTYESSDEDVATIDNSGVITLVGRGTTTITANVAESDNFLPDSKSFTLIVTKDGYAEATFKYNDEDIAGQGAANTGAELTATRDNGVLTLYANYAYAKLNDTHIKIYGSTEDNGGSYVQLSVIDGYAISKVVMTATGEGYIRTWKDQFDAEATIDGVTATWEGMQNKVILMNQAGGQARIKTIDVTYIKLNETGKTITIGETGLATFCSDEKCVLSGAEQFAIAGAITGAEGPVLTVDTLTSSIPAEVGVLLMGAPGVYKVYTHPDLVENVPTTNLLTGVLVDTDAPVGSYVLQEQGTVGFFQVVETAPITVPAGHAYLVMPGATAPAFFFTQEDYEDGISGVKAELSENDAIYNIAGQRLSKMQKGINIVNGKKILK